jgi:hypothetical protein
MSQQIDWDKLITESTTLTAWFKSSGTFLRKYKDKLNKLAYFEVIVPNFLDEDLMKDYVKYYPTQYENVEQVTDAIKRTVDLSIESGGKVYLHRGLIHYPAYVFDNIAVIGIHEFGKIKDITSPNFICTEKDFINAQASWIKEFSTLYENK